MRPEIEHALRDASSPADVAALVRADALDRMADVVEKALLPFEPFVPAIVAVLRNELDEDAVEMSQRVAEVLRSFGCDPDARQSRASLSITELLVRDALGHEPPRS